MLGASGDALRWPAIESSDALASDADERTRCIARRAETVAAVAITTRRAAAGLWRGSAVPSPLLVISFVSGHPSEARPGCAGAGATAAHRGPLRAERWGAGPTVLHCVCCRRLAHTQRRLTTAHNERYKGSDGRVGRAPAVLRRDGLERPRRVPRHEPHQGREGRRQRPPEVARVRDRRQQAPGGRHHRRQRRPRAPRRQRAGPAGHRPRLRRRGRGHPPSSPAAERPARLPVRPGRAAFRHANAYCEPPPIAG